MPNPPEPYRGPNGFVPLPGGGGAPDLIALNPTAPDGSAQAGVTVAEGVISGIDVELAGFNFDEDSAVEIQEVPGSTLVAWVFEDGPVLVAPTASNPGTIAFTLGSGGAPVTAGDYVVRITNGSGASGVVGLRVTSEG